MDSKNEGQKKKNKAKLPKPSNKIADNNLILPINHEVKVSGRRSAANNNDHEVINNKKENQKPTEVPFDEEGTG